MPRPYGRMVLAVKTRSSFGETMIGRIHRATLVPMAIAGASMATSRRAITSAQFKDALP